MPPPIILIILCTRAHFIYLKYNIYIFVCGVRAIHVCAYRACEQVLAVSIDLIFPFKHILFVRCGLYSNRTGRNETVRARTRATAL